MNYDINILIVEDLLTTRLFLRRTLKKLGYTNVVLSEDGEVAIKELELKPFGSYNFRLAYAQYGWLGLL